MRERIDIEGIDDDKIDELMELCDVNKAGMISYEDFSWHLSKMMNRQGGKEMASEPGTPRSGQGQKEHTMVESDDGDDGQDTAKDECSASERGDSPGKRVSPSYAKDTIEEGDEENEDHVIDEDDVSPSSTVHHSAITAFKKDVVDPKQFHRWIASGTFSLSLAGSAEHDDNTGDHVHDISRVLSAPSDLYEITQKPFFYHTVLRPYYLQQPVSNVVMGLIYGTSTYARQLALSKLATVIHTCCGWFFLMPNPKYHPSFGGGQSKVEENSKN